MAENRVTRVGVEVAHNSDGSTARVSRVGAEVLHKGAASLRVTRLGTEVLRSVAEVAPEEFISVAFDVGFDVAAVPAPAETYLSAVLGLGFDMAAVPDDISPVENVVVSFDLGFDMTALAAVPEVFLSATFGLGFDIAAAASAEQPVEFISAAFNIGFDVAGVLTEPNFYSYGPREAFITVTTNLETYDGTPSNLVDGGFDYFAPGSVDTLGIALNDMDAEDPGHFFIQFALLEQKAFYGLKLYKNTGLLGGTWQWQGSDDGSAWTDIAAPFFIDSSTELHVSLPNSTPYFFYRMSSVSGFTSVGSWFEFEFNVLGEVIVQPVSASFSLGADIGQADFAVPPPTVQVIIVVSGR